MPTVELPPRVFDVFDAPPQPQASYFSPPTHSQVLEPTQVDDADARNEATVAVAATAPPAEQQEPPRVEAQADSQRASQKRRLVSRSAAAMLDMEADEEDENGEIVKRGGDDDDDENDGDDEDVCLSDAFLDGEEERHGDVRALHAQMEREAEFGGDGGFDDDGAEDGGAQAAKRRRRSDDGDLAASSDDGDDENSDAGAKASRLSVPLNLREVSEDGAGDETGAGGDGDGDGDAGHAGAGDESDEVDEATKQRFRERAQMRAAKHDFFATHADGLGRSQSNSLFPMLEEHSQHGAALARAVLLNESSQAAPTQTRTRSLLRASSFLVPADLDLQSSTTTAALARSSGAEQQPKSLFAAVVGSMAPPAGRPGSVVGGAVAASAVTKPTPLSPMSRSKSMTDLAAGSAMRRTFSARNPQRLKELMSSHSKVVQNTSSRSVIFASDSQDARTQQGSQSTTTSAATTTGGSATSFFQLLAKKP
jgi:hypothetical protein